MNTITIGTYVERRSTTSNLTQTKPHYVESVIDDEPVCHCGRILKRFRWTDFFEVPGTDVCKRCVVRG